MYEGLRSVAGLERGRSAAREAEPVGPVDDATVDATLPFLSAHVRALIGLMRHTGMRPAEACRLTLAQLDRGGAVWVYAPARHKTAHRGKARSIPLGPHARAALEAFLTGRPIGADEPVFSPRLSRDERFAAMRAARRTKVQPSQTNRKKTDPRRRSAEWYTPEAVAHAVAAACDKAFPPPLPLGKRDGESSARWRARLTGEQWEQLGAWRREHRWHPYQLRHAFATRVRRQFGLEAARVLLGHSRVDVTQVNAERDDALGATVAAQIG